MANVPVPTIAIVTPTPVDTVLGVQAGLVKRFTVSQLQPTAETLAGTALASNVMQASLNSIIPIGGTLAVTGTLNASGALNIAGSGIFGNGSANAGVSAYGNASGVNGGASFSAINAGTPIIAIGNYSAMLGGAYDVTPSIYAISPIRVTTGLNIGGNTSVTGTLLITGQTTAGGGLYLNGPATLAAANASLFSYEAPHTRFYVGDGTGYTFKFSKRASSVTTDLITVADTGTTLAVAGDTAVNGNLSSTGLVASTLNSLAFTSVASGTGPRGIQFGNDGGDFYIGRESNTANFFFPGSDAYASVIYSAQPIQTIISGVVRTSVNAAGLAVNGSVAATVPDEVAAMYQKAGSGTLRYHPYVASLGGATIEATTPDESTYVNLRISAATLAINAALSIRESAIIGIGGAVDRLYLTALPTGSGAIVYANTAGGAYAPLIIDGTTVTVRAAGATKLVATSIGVEVTGTLSTTGELIVASASPTFKMQETDGAVNAKNWDTLVDGGNMYFRLVNDDYSSGNVWLTATRTGFASATIGFTGNTTVVGSLTATGIATFGSGAAITGDLNVSGVLTLLAYGGAVSAGAADSGGTGYRVLRVPN